MNSKSIIFALVAALSMPAVADVTVKSANGKTTITIHESTLKYGFNEHNEIQVQAWTSMRTQGQFIRAERSVTGCPQSRGNLGVVENGRITNERPWLVEGDSVGDDLATNICMAALKKIKADTKDADTKKTAI